MQIADDNFTDTPPQNGEAFRVAVKRRTKSGLRMFEASARFIGSMGGSPVYERDDGAMMCRTDFSYPLCFIKG